MKRYCIVLLSAFLAACAPDPINLYEGNARPDAELSLYYASNWHGGSDSPWTVDTLSIDGYVMIDDVHASGLQLNAHRQQMNLLPGRHTAVLGLMYFNMGLSMTGPYGAAVATKFVYPATFTVQFDTKPGLRYAPAFDVRRSPAVDLSTMCIAEYPQSPSSAFAKTRTPDAKLVTCASPVLRPDAGEEYLCDQWNAQRLPLSEDIAAACLSQKAGPAGS